MAFTSLDTTWSGTYAPYLINKAISGMDTMKKGVVFVEDNIKKIHTIDRVDMTDPLSPRQEQPTDDGEYGFNIDGRVLIPQDIQAYREVNPRDLEATQFAKDLSETILARQVPPSMQAQLLQLLLNRSAEQIEKGLWMASMSFKGKFAKGDPQYQLQFFNGFMQRMVNDPLINLSSISPVTITSANIVAILDDLITQATNKAPALISDELSYVEMKFLMNVVTWNIYTQALRAANFKGLALDESGTPKWGGWRVERLTGMPNNTIVFCRATDNAKTSNLWVGMNSSKDWDLQFDRVQNFSEKFGMLAKWKFDVNYGWPEEIFMYTTVTQADFIVA